MAKKIITARYIHFRKKRYASLKVGCGQRLFSISLHLRRVESVKKPIAVIHFYLCWLCHLGDQYLARRLASPLCRRNEEFKLVSKCFYALVSRVAKLTSARHCKITLKCWKVNSFVRLFNIPSDLYRYFKGQVVLQTWMNEP